MYHMHRRLRQIKKCSLVTTVALFLIPFTCVASLQDVVMSTQSHKEVFEYELVPGQFKEDMVRVINSTDETLDLIFYPADSTPTADGSLAFKQQRQLMNNVGSWIRLFPFDPPTTTGNVLAALYDFPENIQTIENRCSIVHVPVGARYATFEEYLTGVLEGIIDESEFSYLEKLVTWCNGVEEYRFSLAAQEQVAIPFVISLPTGVVSGEHTGGLILEKKSLPAVEETTEVQSNERKAMVVTQTVPGEIVREVAVTKFDVAYDGTHDRYDFSLELENDGNVSQDLTITFVVEDVLFSSEVFSNSQAITVLRESNLQVSSAWPKPRWGRYAVQAAVTVNTKEGTQIITTPEIVITLVPWLGLSIGIGLLILLIVLTYFIRVKVQKNITTEDWRTYTIKKDDTLELLSQKCQVPKKHIIWVNEISWTSRLVPGQKILIPKFIRRVNKKNKQSIDGATRSQRSSTVKNKSYNLVEDRFNKLQWPVSIIVIIIGVAGMLAIIRSHRDASVGETETVSQEETVKSNIDSNEKNNAEIAETEQSQASHVLGTTDQQEMVLPEHIRIKVLNGSGVAGAAGVLAKELERIGFIVQGTGNADHFGYNGITVSHSTTKDSEYDVLASELVGLGYNSSSVISEEGDQDTLTVIVGQ